MGYNPDGIGRLGILKNSEQKLLQPATIASKNGKTAIRQD